MLSDAKIRSLRPKEKAYKGYDERGLCMVVNPNGSPWWRFKYKYDYRERGISLGVYPAHRALQRCGQIFRYALATGRATRDITSNLRGALAPVVVENRTAITEPAKIGALLRAIDDYIGHPTTLIALKVSPLVFLRPSELRAAEWSEIDLQTAEWRVGESDARPE